VRIAAIPKTSSSASSTESDTPNTTQDLPNTSFELDVIDVVPFNSGTINMLYEPRLDKWSREVALLNSLHPFLQDSPGAGYTFCELFPHMPAHFITLSMGNEGLRHSCLAAAAMVRDIHLGHKPSDLYLVEKTSSLRLLQQAISSDAVNECLFLAVIMQIFTDLCTGKFISIQRHLRGLYLIYRRIQIKAIESNQEVTPMARFVARMAAQTDQQAAGLFEDFPQWPLFTFKDEVEDRKWLARVADISKHMTLDHVEWALASFEIENLWHRTYTFAKRSDIYRTSNDPEAEHKIRQEYNALLLTFELWRGRSIIVQQDQIEKYFQKTASSKETPSQFLWHEPLLLHNSFYAKLQNQWRAAWIYASTIIHPFPGPQPDRFQIAVDMCRTHASLGQDVLVGPLWRTLFYAGLVFGGDTRYPLESAWVLDRLRDVVAVFPAIGSVVDRMPAAWGSDTVHWNSLPRLSTIYVDEV
jgi:hypothetical protein